ncbi:serine/threonine-protein phosphatase 6 regulatory ankyrin repeat subunit B-like [Pomacea canaliculata]|uniref:serine/threonine-protein phosphatase 6 regulatory ankyrin repeat subunit B-like n=1 Tax=Pomacea canaliculata TaxID=400727 RepID=UPI000D72BC3F|nr:serine/threonine-protein phosphatase 6 regulatory ankyrin repeat subunit B-like [Pomacea canaliculata]
MCMEGDQNFGVGENDRRYLGDVIMINPEGEDLAEGEAVPVCHMTGGHDVSCDDEDEDTYAVPSDIPFVENKGDENEVISAVRENDCLLLQQLAQKNVDFNSLCHCQWVPCTIRVQRGDFSRQLQMTGYAAIHVAVIHASIKTIKCLLTGGADINLRDSNRRSPLQLAAAVDRLKVVRLLIDKGADINNQSSSLRTPLLEAITNHSEDLVRTLVESGADVNLPDIKGTTPLSFAVGHMYPSSNFGTDLTIIRILLDAGCDVDKSNPAGASALMLAAGLKLVPVIHMLLSAGANINKMDNAGHNAFHTAVAGQRNLSAMQTLMWNGAATHTSNKKGETPLDKALQFGSISILRLLLSADAAPHRHDIMTAPRIVQLRNYLPEFDAWLRQEMHEPRSLRRICREMIRYHLSPHGLTRMSELELPRTLVDFLLGRDVVD